MIGLAAAIDAIEQIKLILRNNICQAILGNRTQHLAMTDECLVIEIDEFNPVFGFTQYREERR